MIEHLRAAWDEMIAPGAPFAMSDIEVRGIPTRVFDAAPSTMRDIWALTPLFGDRYYVVYEDERYTYAEIGAQVRRSVRRIKIAMVSACPYQAEYHLAYLYLKRAAF